MTDATANWAEPAGLDVAGAARRYRTQLAVGAVLALCAGAAYGGNAWGRHEAGPRQVTGMAYATPYQIGVTVDGWSYDIPLSVPWTGADGVLHYGERPACLPASKDMQRVTFTYAPVSVDGGRLQQVVWVSCRGH